MGEDKSTTEQAPPEQSVPGEPAAAPDGAPVCIPECEQYERHKDKGYSRRRAWYVGITTAWCILCPVIFVIMGKDSELAKQTANGLLGLAGTICMFYLGAGVVDRSRVLEKVGDGWSRRWRGDGQ